MTCPNAATSVTIPLSGSTTVTIYDQNCNVLPAGSVSVTQGNNVPVTSSTMPAVTISGGVLTFTANGSPPGLAGTLKFTYMPANQSVTMTYIVGAPVTSISAGTLTP